MTSVQADPNAFANCPCYILVNTFPENVSVAEHIPEGFVISKTLTISNPNRADAEPSNG